MRYIEPNVDNKNKAAGILTFAMDSGRFLLALRKEGVYSTIGGFLCWGENRAEGAIREFEEETGYDGPLILLKGYTHENPMKNFSYTNFIGICPQEFEPILDDENIEAEWFTISQLYGGRLPLHNGFETFIFEARPLIDSMMKDFGFLNP